MVVDSHISAARESVILWFPHGVDKVCDRVAELQFRKNILCQPDDGV